MGNVFRVINCDGDIEISIYKKANAVFKTNEYNETEDVCIHKETINIFDLLKENQELKKQLEEWEHHLKCSKEMLEIQGQKGNYDYDEYMLGLYNGMEYVMALFETREPNYISGKDVKFTNNNKKQKEFIKYLEDEINNITTQYSQVNGSYFLLDDKIKMFEKVLQKYKEIVGDDK